MEEEEAGDSDEGTEQGVAVDAHSQSEMPSSAEDEGAGESAAPKLMKESSENYNSWGKTLKKPDKILPCPRCDSMDTKFCYYNNYNMNQPRHFCRACQRYWTAGDMMRNVSVGASRRKNKSAASGYRHVIISGAVDGAKTNVRNSVKKQGEDCSSSASSIAISSADNGSRIFASEQDALNRNGIASQIPCITGLPSPYPWSPAPRPAFYPAAAFWTWNIPFMFSQQPSSLNKHGTNIPSTDSAMTGKHSRDTRPEVESLKQVNGCLVVPKIGRMDDPDEAAKSSIWMLLGIKHDATATGASLSGGFLPKGLGKIRDDEKLLALHVNPAALSRSLNFHGNN